MSESIYQSIHTGTKIDEAVSKVPTLEEQINSLAAEPTQYAITPGTGITLIYNRIIKRNGFIYVVGVAKKTDGTAFAANVLATIGTIPSTLQPKSGERVTLTAFAASRTGYYPEYTAAGMVELTTIYASTPISNAIEIGFSAGYYVGGGTL